MSLWSQMVHVTWPPELRFYEVRTELLRALDDAGDLAAFRWDESLIGARLGQSEVIEVSPYGAMFFVTAPDGDLALAEAALARAVAMIKPEWVSLGRALFQCLLPIDSNYDDARRAAAVVVTGGILPEANAHDFSLFLDGASSALKAVYTTEFGIVNYDEMSDRLARRVGRMATHLAPLPEDMWQIEEAPNCGFFMDIAWSPSGGAVEPNELEALAERWHALGSETDRMATTIYERLNANLEGQVTGS